MKTVRFLQPRGTAAQKHRVVETQLLLPLPLFLDSVSQKAARAEEGEDDSMSSCYLDASILHLPASAAKTEQRRRLTAPPH